MILAVFIAGCGGAKDKPIKESKTNTSVSTTKEEDKMAYSDVPTLFLHGAGGGKSSLRGMINRFNRQDVANKALVVDVSAEGEVSVEKELADNHFKKNNPMVQVVFEDNRNNEWEQASWIKSVLSFLQKEYAVKEVNIVGHSMGGISGLRYLIQDGSNQELPKVNKFVAIGAPFNEFLDTLNQQTLDDLLAKGPTEKSGRFATYEGNFINIPKEMNVLLVAGKISEEDLSDKIVPLSSALSINELLIENGNDIRHLIVEGRTAEHSALHENQGVDATVSEFLWLSK